jgi:hypothetical protein
LGRWSVRLYFFRFLRALPGLATNTGSALEAITVILIGIFSVIGRKGIDGIYRVSPRPLITRPLYQALVAVGSLYILSAILGAVTASELSQLTYIDPTTKISFLAGTSVAEELFARHLIFGAVFVAGVNLFRSYWISAIAADITSSFMWYFFHFYAYNLSTIGNAAIATTILTSIFIAGIGLGFVYFLTGNAWVVIFIHVWIDIAKLVVQILLPGFSSVFIPGAS